MVDKILQKAGFILNKTYRENRFVRPPKSTYAVYTDAREVRGADYLNLIADHDIDIEVYSYEADSDAEKRVESAFNFYGVEYTKQPRIWLDNEQLYQVIYEFSYIDKGVI